MNLPLDQRPLVVAIAGPNGAGKTTFYFSHLQSAGLHFINADVLARELNVDPYAAARVADSLRRELIAQRQSFVFESVFWDPNRRETGISEAGLRIRLHYNHLFYRHLRAGCIGPTRSHAHLARWTRCSRRKTD